MSLFCCRTFLWHNRTNTSWNGFVELTNIHCVSKKFHFYFCNNFGKFRPIFIILSLLYFQIYCWGSWYFNDHLTSSLLPHYIVKLECATVQLYKKVIKLSMVQWRLISINVYQKCYLLVRMSMQTNLQHVFEVSACRTRACIGTSVAYTSDVQWDRHGVRRSFKTRLHRVVFL